MTSDARQPTPAAALPTGLVIALGVAAGRLPFLGAGYGQDPDAWRVAAAARTIAETHRYVASRPPGAPVHEITSAFFIDGGAPALNGLTAGMSVVAALALAAIVWTRTARRGWARAAIAGAAALGFAYVPSVYLNSTVALDYLWAIAFAALAWLAACRRRPVAAGVGLGLAIGCRFTSVLLLPSLLVLLGAGAVDAATRRTAWARALAAAALSGAVCVAPALWLRGATLGRAAEAPSLATLDLLLALPGALLGQVGAVGLACALLLGVVTARRHDLRPVLEEGSGLARAALLAIALHVALFVAFPFEVAYLLPAVAFGVLLLSRALPPAAFVAGCALLASASFLPDPWLRSEARPLSASPFFRAQHERARTHAYLLVSTRSAGSIQPATTTSSSDSARARSAASSR